MFIPLAPSSMTSAIVDNLVTGVACNDLSHETLNNSLDTNIYSSDINVLKARITTKAKPM